MLKKIKTAYHSLLYYKKYTLFLFLLSVISILSLTFIDCLRSIQQINFEQISERWSLLATILPKTPDDSLTAIRSSHAALMQNYSNLFILSLIASIIFFGSSIFYMNKRRHAELKIPIQLGIKNSSIIHQCTLEIGLTMLVACLSIVIGLFICHYGYRNLIIQTNDQLFNKALPENLQETAAVPQQNSEKRSADFIEHEILLPFNGRSLYMISTKNHYSFAIILRAVIRCFLIVASLVLLITVTLLTYHLQKIRKTA